MPSNKKKVGIDPLLFLISNKKNEVFDIPTAEKVYLEPCCEPSRNYLSSRAGFNV